MAAKSSIIARLEKEILPLQGFTKTTANAALDVNLGPMRKAFPFSQFPTGVMHEFMFSNVEAAAATGGFVSVILASLMRNAGACIWISNKKNIFPSALKAFGVLPHHVIFIQVTKEKDIAWIMEESLKCEGLRAVVADIPELSFTASRRLQLAVEKSKVTGFILRQNPTRVSTTACVTRWKITSLPTQTFNNMPGIGFPKWNVELLKVRNGHPGKWQVECVAGKFRHFSIAAQVEKIAHKKVG